MHLMAKQLQGSSCTHTTRFSFINDEAGLSSLGPPTGLGGAGGGLAAMAAASTLSRLATL